MDFSDLGHVHLMEGVDRANARGSDCLIEHLPSRFSLNPAERRKERLDQDNLLADANFHTMAAFSEKRVLGPCLRSDTVLTRDRNRFLQFSARPS
ncbi:hypothetical protein SB861_32705 [Paraburkholderia sp. SIMBA_049]